MSRSPYGDAALAATQRVEQCRRRLEQLRSGGQYGDEHVVHAREQLAIAHQRADIAQHRVATLADARADRTRLDVPGDDLSASATDVALLVSTRPPEPAGFPARLARLKVSASEIWWSYVALCGKCSELEIDAALHGALMLSHLDAAQLDQALWERENGL